MATVCMVMRARCVRWNVVLAVFGGHTSKSSPAWIDQSRSVWWCWRSSRVKDGRRKCRKDVGVGKPLQVVQSEQPHQQPSAAAAMRIVPRRDESCWLALFPSVLCFSDPLHACSEEDTAAETAFSSRASQSPAFGGTAMRRRTDRRAISFCRVVFFFLGGILSSDDFSQHKSSTLAWAVRRYESSLFCHEFLFGSNSR